MAIALRKPAEIDKLRAANLIVAQTLNFLKSEVKVGMRLSQLNKMAGDFVNSKGARASFKGLYGFPSSLKP